MSSELTCQWCGGTFARPHPRGPFPKYCREAHRQQAYRARQLRRFADGLDVAQDLELAARKFLSQSPAGVLTGISSAIAAMNKPLPNVSAAIAAMNTPLPNMSAAIAVMNAPLPNISAAIAAMNKPLPTMPAAIATLNKSLPSISAAIAAMNAAPLADFAAAISNLNTTTFGDVSAAIARMNTAPVAGLAAALGNIGTSHADFSAIIGNFNPTAFAGLYAAVAKMNTAPVADVSAAVEEVLQRSGASEGVDAEEIPDTVLETPAAAEVLAAAVLLLAVYAIVQSNADIAIAKVAVGIGETLVGLALVLIQLSAEVQDHSEVVRGVLGIAGSVSLAVGLARIGKLMLGSLSGIGDTSVVDEDGGGRP